MPSQCTKAPTSAISTSTTSTPVTMKRRVRGFTRPIYVAVRSPGYVVHMGELRLYAIGIDEVRDVFRASPELAAELRRVAETAYPPKTTPPAPGLLGKLGPLFRRPAGAPVVSPDTPVEADVADLLAARFIRPERQPAAWRLLGRTSTRRRGGDTASTSTSTGSTISSSTSLVPGCTHSSA